MQKREVIDNDHVLWRELRTYVVPMPALDLSKPHYLPLTSASYCAILHQDYLEVTGKKKGPVRVSSSSIMRFDHEPSKDKRQSSALTCHTLHFSEKTSLRAQTDPLRQRRDGCNSVRIPAAGCAQNHAVGIGAPSGSHFAPRNAQEAPAAERSKGATKSCRLEQ